MNLSVTLTQRDRKAEYHCIALLKMVTLTLSGSSYVTIPGRPLNHLHSVTCPTVCHGSLLPLPILPLAPVLQSPDVLREHHVLGLAVLGLSFLCSYMFSPHMQFPLFFSCPFYIEGYIYLWLKNSLIDLLI